MHYVSNEKYDEPESIRKNTGNTGHGNFVFEKILVKATFLWWPKLDQFWPSETIFNLKTNPERRDLQNKPI